MGVTDDERGGNAAHRSLAVDTWEELFRAEVTVLRELSGDFPLHGLSFTDYDVLFNIARQPGRRLRLRDLNRHLLLTQPSVSRLVDRLVARGCVTKQSDPGDGRGTIVALTDHGYQAFRRAAVVHAESITRRVGSALTDDELTELARLTRKLRLGDDSPPE
ncbi:MarR family winged helix-turn-helix transcriptional regulator [Galbitalea sp. SE-J8]|uniref:MarR family winged helix-turn-helix transcriptional regulator n=1 Tax=Galbitalea sp. SE-J8 TaxID=3054952 RepID=UPI00259D066F|nr:MarR family winged helix-turn-helix transcriptional regulator [Galbitalea sp. SE-J8]MDM4762366.1 MarR family winged helix-turn-helix transcriptional regulator [Galbitalea sp. SE-J8]